MKTQVGGKYSNENPGLFALRRQLIACGIAVRFPEGDAIVATKNGVHLSFDPETSGVSLYQTECNYLNAIREGSFHTIYNINGTLNGYVGVSASMELLYALMFDIPVFLIHNPCCSGRVPEFAKSIILDHRSQFNVVRLDLLSGEALFHAISSRIPEAKVSYGLGVLDHINIMKYVESVLSSYK